MTLTAWLTGAVSVAVKTIGVVPVLPSVNAASASVMPGTVSLSVIVTSVALLA